MPHNQLRLSRQFSATAWRRTGVIALFSFLFFLLSLAFSPLSFADDNVSQDDYEAGLMQSYSTVFAGTQATEEQKASFISCLSQETYSVLSAETIQALAVSNLKYEISNDEADIFLAKVDTCAEKSGVSDIVAGSQSREAGVDSGQDANASDVPEANKADSQKTPSYLLPLAIVLTLLTIIVFAFHLRSRSDEPKTDDEDE